MIDQHPITPTVDLIRKWNAEAATAPMADQRDIAIHIAIQAARWGADQELEACREWLNDDVGEPYASDLRAARRPKPPSLKEQALEALDRMDQLPTAEDQHIIRRALESLPDTQD